MTDTTDFVYKYLKNGRKDWEHVTGAVLVAESGKLKDRLRETVRSCLMLSGSMWFLDSTGPAGAFIEAVLKDVDYDKFLERLKTDVRKAIE